METVEMCPTPHREVQIGTSKALPSLDMNCHSRKRREMAVKPYRSLSALPRLPTGPCVTLLGGAEDD